MKTKNDESFLLERLLFVKNRFFFGNWFKCWNILNSLTIFLRRNHWVDSSGKGDLPPDFYNEKLRLMMDVMRVDDSAFIDARKKTQDETLQKEDQLLKKYLGRDYRFYREDSRCYVVVKSTIKNCTYEKYLNNFKRVLLDHNSKIDQYQKNHHSFKTIFFVYDESNIFVELSKPEDKEALYKVGSILQGKIHYPFLDNNFIDVLKQCQADYVIWLAPYKALIQSSGKMKSGSFCAVFDKSKIQHIKTKCYNTDLLCAT